MGSKTVKIGSGLAGCVLPTYILLIFKEKVEMMKNVAVVC